MTSRDTERLTGVHPTLIAAIVRVLGEMSAEQASMFVVGGVRTTAQQQALYAQGRTAPGPIVTYKDGVVHKSNHQPHEDGFGYAVDCAFVSAKPFDVSHPWEKYGTALEQLGITWGGRWKMVDKPHAELTEQV